MRQEIRLFHPDVAPDIQGKAEWRDTSYEGLIIKERQADMISEPSAPINKATLYRSPIEVISDICLNEDQEKASRYETSPSVIQGPAGCGKSIVICHKVANTVKKFHYCPNLKILVTTFNKELVKQLAKWLKELFDEKKVHRTFENNVQYFRFSDSKEPSITLLHFDILPFRIGLITHNGNVNETANRKILETCVDDIKTEKFITGSEYDNILNTQFLLEEYHRIIYGLEVDIRKGHDKYQKIDRTGRGTNPSLQKKWST